MITVSICCATPKKQLEISLKVEKNSTVVMVIRRSDILQQFPEINLTKAYVGIYGRRVTLSTSVQDGDRIEIYRSLLIDPKQARLLRAQRLVSN
ncbi:RnfH family protein [Coxiella endosymbiont of Dermacentor marginatus]|uniref:RnfH family protein n=1 Tax=Coxiella endosymbiont of Dermacentor marginatus TaxID=1656159 RepID=UPI002222DB79|nr:RnfH family protein [Coxiella endosymbiont of Dermacentor marginatus]